MLPFLKPKKMPGLIISTRMPDGGTEDKHDAEDADHGLDAASEDLYRAIQAKDIKAISAALKAAYEMLDSSEPQEEASEEEQASE